jgi:hypothetical protein
MHTNQKRDRTRNLADKLVQELENTELITHVKIHLGNIFDPKNPSYIEYKTDEKKTNRRECSILRASILKILRENGTIIELVYDSSLSDHGIHRERIEIKTLPQRFEETIFIERMLGIIDKQVSQYNQTRKQYVQAN